MANVIAISGDENPATLATPEGDLINGDDGDDTLRGGEGRDTLNGAGGDDLLYGEAERDTLSGGSGDDTLYGGTERDALSGGSGDDLLHGGEERDDLSGGSGEDMLYGGQERDTLSGGSDDDTLDGGAGSDVALFAGDRADYTVARGRDATGSYTLVTDINPDDGGEGVDRIYNIETLQFADGADPVCFYPGTLVATPSGEVAVEALRAGDLVLTAEGEAKPVRWLGRQTVSTRFGDPLRVLPIRITAGALGEGLPTRDLLVSPDHALLVDGVLVQAGALVNGGTIRREAAVPEVFTYYHVELADHSLVLAEGVPAETFVDNVDRLAFDNWAEHEAAADPAPVAEMALPRAKSARQVPMALRRRLAGRAASLERRASVASDWQGAPATLGAAAR